MPTFTSRVIAPLAAAALTAYSVVSVAVWALALCLVERRSGRGVTDLFG